MPNEGQTPFGIKAGALLISCLLFFSIPRLASAVTTNWLGGDAGGLNDWDNALNWDNGIPTSVDTAVIPAGRTYYPILTSPATTYQCQVLTIDNGGEVHWAPTSGTVTLTVAASATNNGQLIVDNVVGELRLLISTDFTNGATGSATMGTTGVIEFQGASGSSVALTSGITSGLLRVNKTGVSVSFSTATNSYHHVTVLSGTLNLGTATHSISGDFTISGGSADAGSASVTLSGNFSNSAGFTGARRRSRSTAARRAWGVARPPSSTT